MKKLFFFLVLLIAFTALQAQNVDVKLGANTRYVSFNVQDNNGDTNFVVQGNGVTFVKDSSASLTPLLFLEQKKDGDATLTYYLSKTNSPNVFVATGVDNSDNDNFKICNNYSVTGNTYSDAKIMMQLHNENTQAGILDINHQSRSRAYLNTPQSIGPWAWTPIEFEKITYDEHNEFTPGFPGSSGFFKALEEGYYQVNSRYEYNILEQPAPFYCIVSIAIYVNGVEYARGNTLQLNLSSEEPFNNQVAPNVSDVVYLMQGDIIEIYAFHTYSYALALTTGTTITYVSIHKVS